MPSHPCLCGITVDGNQLRIKIEGNIPYEITVKLSGIRVGRGGKRFKKYSPYNSNLIVVLGGDGFMLETLKKYRKYNKPFYGMNKGTFGFLMNKFKTKNIKKIIAKAKPVSISALEMHAITKDNIKKSAIAINEVSLLRQSKQAASLQILNGRRIIKNNGVKINDKTISDEKRIVSTEDFLGNNYIKLSIGKKIHLKVIVV